MEEIIVKLAKKVKSLKKENRLLKKEVEKLNNYVCEYEIITEKLYDMLQECGVDFDTIEETIYNN